ncbi:MAG: PspC domain-containing protein [Pedobacter sp.]|nr:PspC domain-containing protein [Pedobacter sp.]MDQ8053595.1 PspC domain-containing protein [Pedobacter sp.]
MKKTLIINIGNSIIHIEEDAYELLTGYLNEIKHHFARNADDFEIVTDIENRIAEMFVEILANTQRQVIEITDVQAVIGQMGRVQDFQHEEESASENVHHMGFAGEKKLYRDTDEGVIAGVCAGLGHYLNIEARWVRLIALLVVFLGGAGILAYLILWIATPRAVTRSEKMEMKGEATNLYGYQRSFDEELAAFKEKMKSANPHFQNSGNFITEFFAFLGKILTFTGKIIGKLIAGAFIVCGFGCMVGLLTIAAFFIFWDYNSFDYFPLSVINEGFRKEIILAAFVVLFVPILALVLFGLRVAFNKMAISRNLSFALLIIWLIGVCSTIYYVAKITSEFKEHAELVKSTPINSYPTYVIDVDKTMVFSKQDSIDYGIKELQFDDRVVVNDDDDHPFQAPREIHIQIEKSDNEKTTLVQTYESQGKTFQVALENARNINYRYHQQDSLLTFSPRFDLKKETSWRNQEVFIVLKVPVGTHLMINNNVYRYLQFYYSCDSDSNSDFKEWIMTENGLKCKSEVEAPQ